MYTMAPCGAHGQLLSLLSHLHGFQELDLSFAVLSRWPSHTSFTWASPPSHDHSAHCRSPHSLRAQNDICPFTQIIRRSELCSACRMKGASGVSVSKCDWPCVVMPSCFSAVTRLFHWGVCLFLVPLGKHLPTLLENPRSTLWPFEAIT